jgi:glucose/arabinose dehydrogenase
MGGIGLVAWRTGVAASLAAAAVTLLTGCGDDGSGNPAATTEAAQTAQAGDAGPIALEKIGDFDQPVFVAQPPGGDDLYVVEKGGRVRRLAADGSRSTALDVSGEISDESEQGLLSIAFAPDFQSSRLLYAYMTETGGDQLVVEYSAAEDGTIDPASRREVLSMDDFAPNHNGGLLVFGPDGLLYIGTGDGGIADDPERTAQDLGSPLGKILRIDPSPAGGRAYSVPAENPFASRRGAAPEVYSYGLRNPWRFSFDRATGDLWIGDVGQNTLEEIDHAAAGSGAGSGANFGWSAFEGTQRFNEDQDTVGAVAPLLVYGRDRGCSVTGGYVVRDPGLPKLQGRYLYGDFCAGELRSLALRGGRASGDRELGLEVPQLSSFAEDDNGRIYATSLDGPVFRLVQ